MTQDIRYNTMNPFIRVRQVLVSLFKNVFQNPQLFGPDMGNPWLVKLTDDGDYAKDTKLIVADIYHQELKEENPRPMLITSRQNVDFQEMSMDNSLNFGFGHEDWSHDRQTILTSGIVITAYSRNQHECEDLAFAAAGFINNFRKEVRIDADLGKIGFPISVAAPVPYKRDSKDDLFQTVISAPINASYKWTVKPKALEAVSLKWRGYWDAEGKDYTGVGFDIETEENNNEEE